MPEPAKDVAKRTDVPTDWPRLLARLSAASAFVCFTLNCVVNQLMLKNPQPGRDWVWTAADAASVGVIVLGIGAGLVGLYGGIQKKSGDTIGIALLGILLNSGILFVAFWLRAALKSQGG